MLFGKNVAGHRQRRTVRDGEAELAVRRRRLHIGVRVRLHAGIDADEDVLHHIACSRLLVERIRLGIGVHDDAADAGIERFRTLLRQFVVAVQIDLFRRETRRKRGVELSARNDVDADALLFCDRIHRLAGKRLAGVQNKPVPAVFFRDGIAVQPHHTADIGLVKDVERRSELARKLHAVRSSDLKMSGRIYLQSISRIHLSVPSFVAAQIIAQISRSRQQKPAGHPRGLYDQKQTFF